MWADHTGGKTHLVKAEEPTILEVNDYGEVEHLLGTLCGRGLDADTHRFKGLDSHRDIDWCQVCTHLYHEQTATPAED